MLDLHIHTTYANILGNDSYRFGQCFDGTSLAILNDTFAIAPTFTPPYKGQKPFVEGNLSK